MINQKAFESGVAIVGENIDDLVYAPVPASHNDSVAKLNKAVKQIAVATGLKGSVVTGIVMTAIDIAKQDGPKGYAKKDFFISTMHYELVAASNLAAMNE